MRQSGGFFQNYLACEVGLLNAFRTDLDKVRKFGKARARAEPHLKLRLAACEEHLKQVDTGGPIKKGMAVSELHGHMLGLHIRLTGGKKMTGRSKFYAYKVKVVYPLRANHIFNNFIEAMKDDMP